jgi:predicted phage-related endonuclease
MDEIARWGLLLEPAILAEFTKQSGVAAEKQPSGSLWTDVERPFICATPDALTESGEPVELKTAHFAAANIWATEVPPAYLCQVQHQIHVTQAACGYIAVLVDGYKFAWHRVLRHQRFIDSLLKRLERFWNEYVVKRVPPPTDYSKATSEALARKYPASNGKAIELPAELESLVAEYDELTKTESAASKRKDEIKNLLKEKIGDNEYGTFTSGTGFKWSGKDERRTFRRAKRCPEPTGATQ